MPWIERWDVALDQQAEACCRQLAGSSFPWDITRALELALLKTFCLPSISGLLGRSGEFLQRPRKRYDDTGLMVAELMRHGPESTIGQAVIQRMNRIHGHYAISNDDFLYVLSTFVAEPIRWLERYGWRPLRPDEQQALFRFWQAVGQQMGIQAIPTTLEDLLAIHENVELQLFRPAASNQLIADATLAMLLDDWPRPLQPVLGGLLKAVVDPHVADSLGWRASTDRLRRLVRTGLRLRSRLANGWKQLRRPVGSRFYSQRPTPSYGQTFQLQQLGPPALLSQLNSPRWLGSQRRIGLTGGIASGKSSAGHVLENLGIPVLDADLYAREALAPGTDASTAVLARYGTRVLAEQEPVTPTIDRAALGRIVFSDACERHWLEQLVHPIVRRRFDEALAAQAQAPTVVLMIPLLFESGLEALCSEVWLVDCDAEQQLQRLQKRDNLDEADARSRLAAQWPLARKRQLADRIINNRGRPDQLVHQLQAALDAAPRRQACPDPGIETPGLP